MEVVIGDVGTAPGQVKLNMCTQVLATDGVWEVMTAQEVAHFVQRWRKRPWQGWNASDALTLEAQERWKQLQQEVRNDPR